MSSQQATQGTCGSGGRLLLARAASSQAAAQLLSSHLHDEDSNQLSVDTDFDSYWEEEARNPHRNRIRIGRQYQATVPPLAAHTLATDSPGEHSAHYHRERQASQLETLSFCPAKAAQLTDPELHHYFMVAKSLNLFAELVQTRSLLGRDVTIADLNRIRNKEGLSLASVIQPPPTRQPTTTSSPPHASPQVSASAAHVSPPATASSPPGTVQSPKEHSITRDSSSPQPVNQPLMKALSHFISLHHPCHHDPNCKKLGLTQPTDDDASTAEQTTVSDNLRQTAKPPSGRSRSALKQQQQQPSGCAGAASRDELELDENVCNSKQASSQEWSREEIELFSKAIEVCGKNFGSIKKEFLPTKSVRSIVEYYYIGLRGISSGDGSVKRKASQNSLESTEPTSCSHDKSSQNNNSHGGGSGGPSSSNGSKNGHSSSSGQSANSPSNTDNTPSSGSHINQTYFNSPSCSETTSTNKQSTYNSNDIHIATPNHNNLSAVGSPPVLLDANGVRQAQISTCSGGSINKNIDARMSVYNFDDEFKEESTHNSSAIQLESGSNNSGISVKPLKAKPIMPNSLIDTDSANSNLGSLKFFMDGQLILKLNACQDQQEGQEKCHWVQSGERLISANSKQKKLAKRSNRLSDGQLMNGSQSNSLVSSFQDEDSKTGAEFVNDEDSKESLNSSLSQSSNHHSTINQQSKNQQQPTSSPSGNKRLKMNRNIDASASGGSPLNQQQLHSPINYNRLAMDNTNRIKDNNSSLHSPLNTNPAINHQAAAAAAAMPWLQANSFAMAAALLGQLPFPTNPAANMVEQPLPPPTLQGNINSSTHNLTSKPMDLSLEHTTSTPNKSIQSTNNSKSTSRSKSSRPRKA